jgi:hypothetical protein
MHEKGKASGFMDVSSYAANILDTFCVSSSGDERVEKARATREKLAVPEGQRLGGPLYAKNTA